MSLKTRVLRGFKKLPSLDDEDMVNLQELQEHHGLVATKDMLWHQAMDKLPEQDRAYIIAMLRRGEQFTAVPRITVSTIHGAKGGEAENVVVFTDLSPAADQQMSLNPDDMHRTFYVAITRSLKNLFLVEPQDHNRSYQL
jgi:superfamily I DNA/RNA helicase